MEDQFFTLFAGLIGLNNLAGTTLMSQNHGTAVNIRGPAVAIGSTIVSVSNNHIITDKEPAFFIGAVQGLFTNNLTNQSNSVASFINQVGQNIQII